MVSIATGWNIKSGGWKEYLVSFLFEAVSAALPAEWDVECRYESETVLTTVTSHVRGLPPCYGINVSPSGRLPFSLARSTGSLVTGTPAAVMARAIIIIIKDICIVRPSSQGPHICAMSAEIAVT